MARGLSRVGHRLARARLVDGVSSVLPLRLSVRLGRSGFSSDHRILQVSAPGPRAGHDRGARAVAAERDPRDRDPLDPHRVRVIRANRGRCARSRSWKPQSIGLSETRLRAPRVSEHAWRAADLCSPRAHSAPPSSPKLRLSFFSWPRHSPSHIRSWGRMLSNRPRNRSARAMAVDLSGHRKITLVGSAPILVWRACATSSIEAKRLMIRLRGSRDRWFSM